MFEGEFTHEGDLCSFEVMVIRSFADDQGLVEIGKIVHDLDMKDAKFESTETPGISAFLERLASAHNTGGESLERGRAIFDDLYECFRRK